MPLTDPVPSSSFDVLARNVQDTDKFVNQETGTFTNRVGKVIKPIPVIESEANAAIISLGWTPVGEFATGFTYTKLNDVGRDALGSWWRYSGSDLPKVIIAGTVPSSPNFSVISFETADNVSKNGGGSVQDHIDDYNIHTRTFANVAAMLAFNGLTTGQRYSTGGTTWEYLGGGNTIDKFKALTAVNVKDFGAKGDGFTNDTAAFIAARGAWDSGTLRFERVVEIPTGKYFLTEDVIGDWVSDSVLSFTNGFYPILQNNGDSKISVGNIIVGTKALPSAGSYRDAFQVSRHINGQTDCHGFADKTTLNPTDAGTYGVFDSTVTMKSNGVVNHLFAFQNRNMYDGTGGGTLENYVGMIHWPSSKNGTIDTNIGVQIRDVEAGQSTVINTNIGVDVADLNGITRIGFRSLQKSGHSFYAPNGGEIYNKGAVGIGLPALTGYPLSVSNDNGSTVARLAASNNMVALMSQYDSQIQLINNASNVCLRVKASTDQYAVTPGVDNTQPLGDLAHRWSTVFAGTGAINTSDEREKTTLIDISEVEKACALELKQNIKKFKFIDAVNKKGDSARIHFGVGAQTVKTIFESHGLNADDYALFCYDEWEANDDDGVIAGSRYGVRYSELAIFILSAI